jgi:hypothetical protein
VLSVATLNAQTVLPLNGQDCNGNSHDLHADLDAGKAVVLFFFMPNCGSCPPPAKKVQTMVNNILASKPGMVTAYAMPYNNSTTCAATASWVTSNGLSLYAPYDSGATQVANYGGFGMPTVVLLGGKAPNRRVMFSTLSFATSDTTQMRDSILALIAPTAVNEIPTLVNAINVYPNPSATNVNISIDLIAKSSLRIDLFDITGKLVENIYNDEKSMGVISKQFNTTSLSNGLYTIRFNVNGKIVNRKLNVVH